ncbi:MAG: thioredoxin family protein, partial [Tolumonas sp.]
LYIAQNGNPWYGAATLFLLSLGMGLPLLLMGIFGGKVLPKAGAWMVFVKQLFAVLLLAMPLFLLERFIPAHIAALLWFGFAITVSLWLVWRLWPATRAPRLKPLMLLILLSGGIFAASQHEWQPTEALPFTAVNNLDELQQQLAVAKAQGKPVMLDLYADWCTACRDLDDKTFSDPQIRQSLSNYQLLRADVSANSAQHRALMQELQVLGLPDVRFFDRQNQPSAHLRIQGFVSAGELQDKLEQCQLTQHC